MGYAFAFWAISLRNSLDAGPDADTLLIDSLARGLRRFVADKKQRRSKTVLQKDIIRILNAEVGWVVRDARQLFPRGTIGVDGESPNSAVVTDNNVLVIRVRGDRERFSFHARSLNW